LNGNGAAIVRLAMGGLPGDSQIDARCHESRASGKRADRTAREAWARAEQTNLQRHAGSPECSKDSQVLPDLPAHKERGDTLFAWVCQP
jgi:hypothetical protein